MNLVTDIILYNPPRSSEEFIRGVVGFPHVLPSEIIQKIIFYLSLQDKRSAALVNRKLFIEVIETTEIVSDLERMIILQPIINKRTTLKNIYQTIKIANQLSIGKPRNFVLKNICYELINYGDLDKASEIADLLSSESSEQYFAWNQISYALIKIGKIDKAIPYITQLSAAEFRSDAIQPLCKICIESGNLDKAIKIVQDLTSFDVYFRYTIFKFICDILTESGQINKAIEIAICFYSQNQPFFKRIFDKGLTVENSHSILKLIKNIPNALNAFQQRHREMQPLQICTIL